jgi:hypothetical protein
MFLAGTMSCPAQQADTLAILKLFMKVCNDYKTFPVAGIIDIRNSANVIATAQDTSHMHAQFSLTREGTYINLGEMEQIANDSLILLVSRPLKKMLLYANHRSVSQQLQLSIGWQLQDSSLRKLAGKYSANYALIAKDTAEITVTSRSPVRLTSLPAGSIRIRFDPVSFQPYRIIQVTRNLRPVTATDYELLSTQLGGQMLAHRDSSYYIVHERVSEYRYDRITHTQDTRLPVTIRDRITRYAGGNYKPVGNFEGYSISKEF